MGSPIERPKSALLWGTYGPYHFARLRGFRAASPGDVLPIQLHRRERSARPWGTDRGEVVTIAERPDIPQRELISELRCVLDREQPDVVVSCGYGDPAMRAGALWARRHRKASVLMHESTLADRQRRRWKERAKRELVSRLFDTAICGGVAQ